jgi:hypothetical protein
MNEHQLERLLDAAAADFEPRPSRARLMAALAYGPRTGPRLGVILSVAAAITVFAGGAAALTGESARIQSPADQFQVDGPTRRDSKGTPVAVGQPGDRAVPAATSTTPHITPTPATTSTTTTTSDEIVNEAEAARDQQIDRQLLNRDWDRLTMPTEPTTTEPPTPTTEPKPEPAPEPKPEPQPEPEPEPKPQPEPEPEPKPEPRSEPTTTTSAPREVDEPPTTSAAPVEFTARQLWGRCDSAPPFDEFKGTATPGLVIEIFSEYGHGRTEATGEGRWYLKVLFEEAPIDEPFRVILETNGGHRREFSFVRTG